MYPKPAKAAPDNRQYAYNTAAKADVDVEDVMVKMRVDNACSLVVNFVALCSLLGTKYVNDPILPSSVLQW